MYDEYSDYDPDWHDEPDRDRRVLGQAYRITLYKGRNGKLSLMDTCLTRFEGEDWGQASGWWEQRTNLNELREDARLWVIEFARNMPNGTSKEFDWSWVDPDFTEMSE